VANRSQLDAAKSGGWLLAGAEETRRPSSESRRRDETTIIYDILALAAFEPATKTRIVYRCNLNFVKAQRLLEELTAASLLSEDGEEGRTRYRTTAQGASYLRQFELLRSLRSPGHV
jgi:predicted transcriptional regulator